MKVDLECQIFFAKLRWPKKLIMAQIFGPMPELKPWSNLVHTTNLLSCKIKSNLSRLIKQRLLDLLYPGLRKLQPYAARGTIMQGLSLNRTW